MPKTEEGVKTWADLAGDLYDKLTGKGSSINYSFENFALNVPDKVGESAVHTKWILNGSLKISTKNN